MAVPRPERIGYTIGRALILHVINVVFLLVLICPLSHDVFLNFELLRTVGRVASTFECELGCQCLYENGVSSQVSELCVYATYLVLVLILWFVLVSLRQTQTGWRLLF